MRSSIRTAAECSKNTNDSLKNTKTTARVHISTTKIRRQDENKNEMSKKKNGELNSVAGWLNNAALYNMLLGTFINVFLKIDQMFVNHF